MKHGVLFKKSILFLIVFAIIVGGIFFDANESLGLSDRFVRAADMQQAGTSNPLNRNYFANYNSAHVLSAAEIKDASVLYEVIKKLERSSSNKRVVILTLLFSFFLSIGAFCKSNLPSIFPWASVICSRNTVMIFIHDQDGLK